MKTMDPVEFATLVVLARMPKSMWKLQAEPILAKLSSHAREVAKELGRAKLTAQRGRQPKFDHRRDRVARDLRFIRQFAGVIDWPA